MAQISSCASVVSVPPLLETIGKCQEHQISREPRMCYYERNETSQAVLRNETRVSVMCPFTSSGGKVLQEGACAGFLASHTLRLSPSRVQSLVMHTTCSRSPRGMRCSIGLPTSGTPLDESKLIKHSFVSHRGALGKSSPRAQLKITCSSTGPRAPRCLKPGPATHADQELVRIPPR